MTLVERVGDMYRAWSTCSDSYYGEPATRADMAAELLRWGWTLENIERRLDEAEPRDEWAMSALEQDAELLGCNPEEVRYW